MNDIQSKKDMKGQFIDALQINFMENQDQIDGMLVETYLSRVDEICDIKDLIQNNNATCHTNSKSSTKLM